MEKKLNLKFIIIVFVVIVVVTIIGIVVVRKNKNNKLNYNPNKNLIEEIEKIEDTELNETVNSSANGNNTFEKEYLEGYEIAGNIEIPKTNIDIPILSKATSSSMQLSVVIMYGVGLNNIGNTVISGLRNTDGSLFGNNDKLSRGDIFYVTDQTGKKVSYEIYSIGNFKASDTSYYVRDTEGKREITLVTENYDSIYNRLAIFAKEK